MFIIEARGTQGNGARVLNPNNWTDVATFRTRGAARAYADAITPEQPSKYLPLVVVKLRDGESANRA